VVAGYRSAYATKELQKGGEMVEKKAGRKESEEEDEKGRVLV